MTDDDDQGVPVSRERSHAPGMRQAQQKGSQGAGGAAGPVVLPTQPHQSPTCAHSFQTQP